MAEFCAFTSFLDGDEDLKIFIFFPSHSRAVCQLLWRFKVKGAGPSVEEYGLGEWEVVQFGEYVQKAAYLIIGFSSSIETGFEDLLNFRNSSFLAGC